jgi:hypothetical protein
MILRPFYAFCVSANSMCLLDLHFSSSSYFY